MGMLLAVDVGTAMLKGVLFQKSGKKLRAVRARSEAACLSAEAADRQDALTRFIRTFPGAGRAELAIHLSGLRCQTRIGELHATREKDAVDSAAMEAEMLLPAGAGDSALAHVVLRPPQDTPDASLRVMAGFCQKHLIAEARQALRDRLKHWKLAMVAAPALHAAHRTGTVAGKDVTLILDIGAQTTQVVAVCGQDICDCRQIPLGFNQVIRTTKQHGCPEVSRLHAAIDQFDAEKLPAYQRAQLDAAFTAVAKPKRGRTTTPPLNPISSNPAPPEPVSSSSCTAESENPLALDDDLTIEMPDFSNTTSETKLETIDLALEDHDVTPVDMDLFLAIERGYRTILEQVSLTVRSWVRAPWMQQGIRAIRLEGGGSTYARLPEMIRAAMQVTDVEPFLPFEHMDVRPDAREVHAAGFAMCAGLAQAYFYDPCPLNLVPMELQSTAERRASRVLSLAAGFLLAILPVPYVLHGVEQKRMAGEALDLVSNAICEHAALLESGKKLEESMTGLEKQLQSQECRIRTNTNMASLFQWICRPSVNDLFLTRLNSTSSPQTPIRQNPFAIPEHKTALITISGEAASYAAVQQYLAALQHMPELAEVRMADASTAEPPAAISEDGNNVEISKLIQWRIEAAFAPSLTAVSSAEVVETTP